jgi:hypothetical protein
MTRAPWVGAALCLAAGLLACSAPSGYVSPFRDFSCQPPPGWKVVVDSQLPDYYQVTFLGPLDPAFFKGVPSMSVRWYRYGMPHLLPGGGSETYVSIDDFMRQLRDVYGRGVILKGGDEGDVRAALSKGGVLGETTRILMLGGKREALYFVAYNTAPAPAFASYGVVSDGRGDRVIEERHAYALMPANGGFYALVYPATRLGFGGHRPEFLRLIKSFQLFHEGPK